MESRSSYLILHGWAGNEPEHWQTWLAERLAARGERVRYPILPDFHHPKLDDWLATLDDGLSNLPDDGVVVCHSLAVILWLHHAARRVGKKVARAVLVAPPSPYLGMEELADFFPVPLDAEGVQLASKRTILVCSDNDPYCTEGAQTIFGDPWHLETIVVPGGGHLNVEAGFGEWPAIEDLVVTR